MKFKFNFKLTAFLVSLFLSLLLVILGSKNKYCLSFGFMLMGASLTLFVWYNNEKMQTEIENLNNEIDEIEANYDALAEETDFNESVEEERVYVLKQMYIRQNKLEKNKKKSIILFNLCGFALIILGFVGMF